MIQNLKLNFFSNRKLLSNVIKIFNTNVCNNNLPIYVKNNMSMNRENQPFTLSKQQVFSNWIESNRSIKEQNYIHSEETSTRYCTQINYMQNMTEIPTINSRWLAGTRIRYRGKFYSFEGLSKLFTFLYCLYPNNASSFG